MDISATQTEMREVLRSPAAFSAWLQTVPDDFRFGKRDAKKIENPDGSTDWEAGLTELEGTPIAYFLNGRGLARPLSDSTHCYWWEGSQAISLMLPEWARFFHKQCGVSPSGKFAKGAL